MGNSLDILNELKEISPLLAGLEKVNVYTIPAGYFESLSDDVLVSLKEEYPSLFTGLTTPNANSVPQGYFDSLADQILAKVNSQAVESASDELRKLSPMLYSIQDIQVFSTPAGYFDGLSGSLLEKVKPQPSRVVSMRRRTSQFFRYAVAAAFTGVMALGVFKFTGNPKTEMDPLVAEGTQIAKENKFDEELAKVSDADIVKYLESNGSDVDAALVAGTVDESELPSQEDYLTDEKALDNYLNNINTKDLNN
ncbi:MAG: hypothetical protein IPI66_05345 [Chitinophagaceae bacterium]|nr:hypothetical protein [Chitinophagaceae bacterium]MBL0055769.1 hypothetical protein [Chitinophagaceae bacterium]